MKTKMEKISTLVLILLLTAALLLGLTGCGGGKVRADADLEGKYIAVAGEALGMTLTLEELDEFSVELKSGGKASMTVDGDTHSVKWQNDDDTVTITVDGEQLVGKRSPDSFSMEDLLGTGVTILFAREGTAAADPAQYLPENDKFLLGKWQSVQVTDILGDPVDDMADDALSLEFSADHTVSVTLAGKQLGPYAWSNLGDWGGLDDADISLNWDITADGIEVSYNDGDYYIFTCPKGGAVKAQAAATPEPTPTATPTPTPTPTPEPTPTASAVTYQDYWGGDWYGWWMMDSCDGVYEDLEGYWWDCCARLEVYDDDTGYIEIWDEDGSAEELVCAAEVSFGSGTTENGCMMSEEGTVFTGEINLAHADWIVDPGASSVSEFEHMICIDGYYEDDDGSFYYSFYLRPWGMDWEDVRAVSEEDLPAYYDSWYVGVMHAAMPDQIG